MTTALSRKLLRLRHGGSYAQVGKGVGCTGEHIRRLEKGTNPSLAIGVGLAKHFGVPLDWLADDDQDWPPPRSDDQRAADIVRDALSAAGLAGELTGDERELVSAWRSMAVGPRARALGYVIGLAAGGSANGAAVAADLNEALANAPGGVRERRRRSESNRDAG